MSKLIVVTGVTGIQGKSVAETFLGFSGWRVRGITRNPTSLTAKFLSTKGVEIVQADFDDKESLLPAFTGATVIFSNTDFWVHLFTAISSPDPSSPLTANQIAYEAEVRQGVNIAEAAASPIILKTLERFILSSLSDARRWSGGKYKNVYHYDSKVEIIRVIHSKFPELGKKMSTLQIGHYVTNWKAFPAMAPKKQADGSFLSTRPISAKTKVPFIVTDKDTGHFVKALVDLEPGKDLLGVSEDLTFGEWMKIFGDVHGVEGKYEEVDGQVFFEGVPDALKNELLDAFSYMDEFGFCGGDPNVLTPELLDFKIPVTTMDDYIKGEDWSSVLNA